MVGFKHYWRQWISIGILALVVSGLMWRSHIPGTWLTGWDTLHPEFNFGLNLKRILWGVWREDQGLGTLAAHSHMSELPRVLILWLMAWFLPLHLVRYVFVSGCVLLGVLGVYVLVREWVVNVEGWRKEVAGLLGGLFYLFNLGTLQHFYVVFEMFAVQYAVVGWLFWLMWRYWQKRERQYLWWLGVIGFLSSPMAYAATLWYVLLGIMGLFLVGLWWSGGRKRRDVKLIWEILGVWVGVNLYWLLPNIYYLLVGYNPALAKINRLFSEEAFLQNKNYGEIRDVLLLKNFLFGWLVFNFKKNKFELLLGEWDKLVVRFGYVSLGLMLVVLVGWLVMWLKHRKMRLAFWLPGLVVLVMLINENYVLAEIFRWLRSHITIFREGLRMPFTKFSLIWMLWESVGFGFGVGWLLELKGRWSRKLGFAGWLVVVGGIMWWGSLFFREGLVSKYVQQKIPQEYFELFEFFKHEPVGRVALFPVQTPFGWIYRKWGYQGAGFLWFGMKQPILWRDFDRWSPYNEGFYREISQAIYNCESGSDRLSVISDQERVSQATTSGGVTEGSDSSCTMWVGRVLRKYDVEYVLLDRSVIEPGKKQEVLRIPEIERVMDELGERVWESGERRPVRGEKGDEPMLTVWRINSDQLSVISDQERVSQVATSGGVTKGSDPFVRLLSDYRMVGGTISPKMGRDVVYEEGEYVELPQDEKFQNRLRNTHSGKPEWVTNLILDSFYPFAGVGTDKVEVKYEDSQTGLESDPKWQARVPFGAEGSGSLEELNPLSRSLLPIRMNGVGWVVVRSKLKTQSSELKAITQTPNLTTSKDAVRGAPIGDSKLEVTNLILDLGKERIWPGVVLAKRERGRLKVKVAVGVPGLRVEGGFQNRLSRQAGINSTVTNLILGGGEWIRRPEWWEGEVEFKESKGKIDYVFLGKKWYDVRQVQNAKLKTQNHNLKLKVGKSQDSSEWVRVGYFPVRIGDDFREQAPFGELSPDLSGMVVEVRAARKSREKQGEVWTKLVQSANLKVQNKFSGSVPPRQGRGGTDLEGMIELWYPVWEGNDLGRRGNQREAKNCDVLGRGRVETIDFSKSQNRLPRQAGINSTATNIILDSVVYKAEGYGVNCDYIPYERYGGFEDYFLIVKGENKTGRSLKIYLHSLEKDQRTILEELLPEGKFEKVYPIEVKNGGGMVLNLETRSFRRVASENVVKQVLLVPAKWGWVRKLKTQNSKLKTTTQNLKLEIEKVRKLGTGMYVVSLRESNHRPATSDKKDKRPVLTLSQGYERGWGAIEIMMSQNRLRNTHPPKADEVTNLILGWLPRVAKLEHVRVDGWKNGWVVPLERDSNQSSVISDQSDFRIIIFYWPQLLEWMGLVGLLGVFVWLWRAHV